MKKINNATTIGSAQHQRTFFQIGTVSLSSFIINATAFSESFLCTDVAIIAILISEIGHAPILCCIMILRRGHFARAYQNTKKERISVMKNKSLAP
jgi:hypothetical protein